VAAVLARLGRDGLQPGDIVALNDPYIGAGTHLNDVVLAMPIFVGERLVGFSVSKAH